MLNFDDRSIPMNRAVLHNVWCLCVGNFSVDILWTPHESSSPFASWWCEMAFSSIATVTRTTTAWFPPKKRQTFFYTLPAISNTQASVQLYFFCMKTHYCHFKYMSYFSYDDSVAYVFSFISGRSKCLRLEDSFIKIAVETCAVGLCTRGLL